MMKQQIAEYIGQETALSMMFPVLSKRIQHTASEKLATLSNSYLEQLGLAKKDVLLVKRGHIINRVANKALHNLTKSQEQVLRLLLENKGAVISFEMIAKELWGDNVERKYSLYAISRLMSDIRSKLRENGIYNEIIHTKRGKGYLINN